MQKKCPKCRKLVDVKTFDGKGRCKEYYYEERPLTSIEARIEAKLGLPFRHLIKHEC